MLWFCMVIFLAGWFQQGSVLGMFTGAFLVGFATGILRGFLGLYTRFFMVFFLDSLTYGSLQGSFRQGSSCLRSVLSDLGGPVEA